MSLRATLLALGLALAALPAAAVQPDEVLEDPALEARARVISAGLRCPICRNESIDESNAAISRELRLLVRERLVAGDTDDEIVEYIVGRYGEFVLLRPDASGGNLILWIAGPAMLIVAGGIGWATIRRRPAVAAPAALTEAEQARLNEILKS